MRCLLALGLLMFAGCTSNGVEKISASGTTSIYSYEGIYLKMINIDGDHIYLRCDSEGRVLSSGQEVNVTYKSGKRNRYVTTLN